MVQPRCHAPRVDRGGRFAARGRQRCVPRAAALSPARRDRRRGSMRFLVEEARSGSAALDPALDPAFSAPATAVAAGYSTRRSNDAMTPRWLRLSAGCSRRGSSVLKAALHDRCDQGSANSSVVVVHVEARTIQRPSRSGSRSARIRARSAGSSETPRAVRMSRSASALPSSFPSALPRTIPSARPCAFLRSGLCAFLRPSLSACPRPGLSAPQASVRRDHRTVLAEAA